MRILSPRFLRTLGVAVVLLCVAQSYGQPLYSSNFSDATGRPGGWKFINAPTQQLWTVQGGQMVTGNGDDLTEGDGRSFALVSTPDSRNWSDYTVSVDVWMSQRNGLIGLAGRWQDRQDHYEGTIEFVEGKRIARIERVSAPLPNALPERRTLAEGDAAQDNLPIPEMTSGSSVQDAHRLSLSFNGPDIVLSLDGKQVLAAKDAGNTRGTAGLVNYRNLAYYDNFSIEGIDAVAAGVPAASNAQTAAVAGATGVAAVTATPIAAVRMPEATATPAPRFTPVPVATPAEQGQYLTTIKKPLPSSILKNMDMAELLTRLTPEERAAYEQYTEAERLNLFRNIRARMITSTEGPGNAEVSAELEDLKKQLADLTSAQKQMADSVAKKILQDKAVAEAMTQVESLQDLRRYPEALDRTNELLREYPSDAVLLAKKRTLERLSEGKYEGYAEQLALNENKYKELVGKAQASEANGNLESAVSAWTGIVVLSPSREEWATEANKKIDVLKQQIAAKTAAQDETIKSVAKNKPMIYAAMGISVGIGLLILFILMRFHKRARARDEQILAHVKDLTQPLVDMHAEIRQLTGTGMLALPGVSTLEDSLGGSTPTSSRSSATATLPTPASAPAPESTKKRGKKEKLAAPVAPPAPSSDLGLGSMKDPLGGMEDHDSLFSFDVKTPTPANGSATVPTNDFPELDFGGSGNGDLMGGADGELDFDFSSPTIEAAPEPKPQPKPEPVAQKAEPVAEPVLVVEDAVDQNAPLDLGLDDLLSEPSSHDATVKSANFMDQTVKLDTGTLDLGGFEADEQPISLDLDLNVSVEEPPSVASAAPLEEMSLDLFNVEDERSVESQMVVPEPVAMTTDMSGFDLDLGSGGSALEMEKPAEPRKASIAMPGLVYEQNFDEEPLGDVPASWSGDQKENVFFHVAESNGSRVLRYFKNAGTDSVHYFCKFPTVAGVVGVEFDICCPQKNKYLLGVYIEKDGNYNQAIRTVIHCIDPTQASLRMQNEPVPYNLGEWRHVRYLVNLNDGTIDGFIDGEQVLTQQTFVNKPSSINTLSIRDNHATTGEMLIDNIKIEKLS